MCQELTVRRESLAASVASETLTPAAVAVSFAASAACPVWYWIFSPTSPANHPTNQKKKKNTPSSQTHHFLFLQSLTMILRAHEVNFCKLSKRKRSLFDRKKPLLFVTCFINSILYSLKSRFPCSFHTVRLVLRLSLHWCCCRLRNHHHHQDQYA